MIDRANKEKEVELKFDLERNVKLVSFKKGKIDISFNEKLNKNNNAKNEVCIDLILIEFLVVLFINSLF